MKEVRVTIRCETSWLDRMKLLSAETPLSLSTFIVEAAKAGAEEVNRRFKSEKIQSGV